MQLREEVAKAFAHLEAAGHMVYLVGGCVRDALLGKEPTDFDLCTSARPEEVCRVFASYRVIETGLQHGTVTILLDSLPLEITTFRRESGYSDGRRPDQVDFDVSLQEDLARRDFTINAMGFHPREGIIDCFGGQNDLQAGILRCVGEPERRFSEDALRLLRALRFAATQGLQIEAETEAALFRNKARLQGIAAERVRVELQKLLCGWDAARVLLRYWEVIGEVLPDLLALQGFEQHSRYHCYDVWQHSVVALANSPAEPILRWAALLHDLGKADCFSLDEAGEGHFFGHATQGADRADALLEGLRFDRVSREQIVSLVRLHDAPMAAQTKQIRRQLSRWGEDFFWQLLALKRADCRAQSPAVQGRLAELDAVEILAKELLQAEGRLGLRELAVNGRDLLAVGYEGPAIGQSLQILLDAVLEETVVNERSALLHFLQTDAGRT